MPGITVEALGDQGLVEKIQHHRPQRLHCTRCPKELSTLVLGTDSGQSVKADFGSVVPIRVLESASELRMKLDSYIATSTSKKHLYNGAALPRRPTRRPNPVPPCGLPVPTPP